MDISDFYQTFFDEADELLADMEQHLLALDPESPDPEQLNAIFRAAHSIKGGRRRLVSLYYRKRRISWKIYSTVPGAVSCH